MAQSRRIAVAATVLVWALASAGVAAAQAPGSFVPSFGSAGAVALGAGTQLFGVAAQANGEVVAVGQTGGRVLVERFTASGSPDGSYTGPAGYARAIAIQPNGDIVIAGSSSGAMLVERLTTSLAPDSTFGSGGVAVAFAGQVGVANGVAVGPDGSIVAAGSIGNINTEAAAAKFSSAGAAQWSVPLNFGPYSVANAVAVQPADGKIVLVGRQTPLQVTNAVIARLNTTGTLDSTFGSSGGAFTYSYPNGGYTSMNAVTLQSNGQIVAGGVGLGASSNAAFLRINANGSLDPGFGAAGATSLPSGVNQSLVEDPIGAYGVGIAGGGAIVGAGSFENTGTDVDTGLWAFTPNGGPYSPFGSGGTVRAPTGAFEGCGLAVIAPSGDLVVVGNAVTSFPDSTPCAVNGSSTAFIAQYEGTGMVTGTVTPPPAALKISLKGVSGSYKTSTVAKKGLKAGVTCNQACGIKLSLVISAGTAKQLKIKSSIKKCTKVKGKTKCKTTKGYLAVTIASGKGSLKASGTSTTTLKLDKAYIKALEKQKTVSVTLQVSATSTATKKGASLKKGITFKH